MQGFDRNADAWLETILFTTLTDTFFCQVTKEVVASFGSS